jgi:hypothetical protein
VSVPSRTKAADTDVKDPLRSFHSSNTRYGSHTAGSLGRSGLAPNAMTSRSASGKFRGLNNHASTMLKTATVAPMAIAKVDTTIAVKPGFRRSRRAPCLRSRTKSSSSEMPP